MKCKVLYNINRICNLYILGETFCQLNLTNLVLYGTGFVVEYSSTPYMGMAPKKVAVPLYVCMCTKRYVQNSALDLVISFYGPYLLFSSVFISNKTLSAAGEHH